MVGNYGFGYDSLDWANDNLSPDEYFDDDYELENCDQCDEYGMEVICPDDLCQTESGCIHGDGEIPCRRCGGRGKL